MVRRTLRRRFFYRVAILFGLGALLVVLIPLILRQAVVDRYRSWILDDPEEVPPTRIAVVFGAAVRRGHPTPVLQDRLDAAIQLYHLRKVNHLIMSGDGRAPEYDEPGVMAQYAIQHGVEPEDITLDRQGLRTYDTCFRARTVYDANEVILVTQAYHLPRALFTCQMLGVDGIGLAADRRLYRDARWYQVREMMALTVAVWELLGTRPVLTGLGQAGMTQR